MLKIADTNCYSTTEVIKELGRGYSPKKINNLRTVGILPPAIKAGESSKYGILGYYPESVLSHLKAIEAEHEKKGTSYPDLVVKYKDQILVLEVKVSAIQDKYQARKQAFKYAVEILNPKKQSEAHFKLSKELKGKVTTNVDFDTDELQRELRKLFRQRSSTSPESLALIKQKIARIQELRELRSAFVESSKEIPFLRVQDMGKLEL